MLYLLATLVLILGTRADGLEDNYDGPACMLERNRESKPYQFPEVLLDYFTKDEYSIKTIEVLTTLSVRNNKKGHADIKIIKPDGSDWLSNPEEDKIQNGERVLPLGTKWYVGNVVSQGLEDGLTIWSNSAAECIEQDGSYVWSTTLGDVYEALFDRDNAECPYVKGEDVYGCDSPVIPPVEPITTADSIEIDSNDNASEDTGSHDSTETDTQDSIETDSQASEETGSLVIDPATEVTIPIDENGDGDAGVDTNANTGAESSVQQSQVAEDEKIASQSIPTWVIPTVAGSAFILILTYIVYHCKQKVVRSVTPDIEAPQQVQILPFQA